MRHWILMSLVMSTIFLGAQDQDDKSKLEEKLALTVAADKTSVTLGESVQVEVKLENAGDADVEVNELVFEDRSVNFSINQELGGKKKDFVFTVSRPDGFTASRVPPSRVVLKPRKYLLSYFKIPAVAKGLMTITGQYHGGAKPVKAVAVAVDVKPAGAQSQLAVVLDTSKGKITMHLYPEEAPNTVMNFVGRVQNGFYNGMIFHRLVPNFVLQTGCPHGLGTGGPGYSLKGEAEASARKHELGTVSMARYERSDHTGSQFFICLQNLPVLDRQYTIVGKVTDTTLLATINNEDTDKVTERPKKDIQLNRATIQVQ